MNRVEIKRKQIQTLFVIIGAVVWLILGRLTGSEGIGYFAAAAECFGLLIILTSAAVPDALGKLLWSKKNKLQYKNERIIRRSALLLQGGMGLLGSVLLLLAAPLFAEQLFRLPGMVLALRIFAPAVWLRAVSAVIIGYFQGDGNMLPSIVVSALRQFFTLGFGAFFARLLGNYGEKVALLVRKEEMSAVYGAAGLAVAVVLTELFLLIFVLIVLMASRKQPAETEEGMKLSETFLTATGGLYRHAGREMLILLLLGLPFLMGGICCFRTGQVTTVEYGCFLSGYIVLLTVPVLLNSILTKSITVRAIAALRKDEKKYARELVGSMLHYHVITCLFGTVFLTTLARETAYTFMPEEVTADLLKNMLQTGGSVVILASLSLFFISVLFQLGKGLPVLIAVSAYALIGVLGTIGMVVWGKAGIRGMIIANMIALLILCILSGWFMLRYLRLKVDLLYWFAVPCIAALVCGLMWMLFGKYLTPHLGFAVTMLVGLVVGLVLYWLIQLCLRSFSKLELQTMPGGYFLNKCKEILPFG